MNNGRSATVHYFVKTLRMDITKFDEVILTHASILFDCLMFTRRYSLLC